MPKKNNWPTGAEPVETRPGELAETQRSMDALRMLPPINIKDPGEVERRITDYFNFCQARSLRPGVEGLCLALGGISRQTLLNWTHAPGERGDAARRAKALLVALLEQWSLAGKLNPATSIFMLKNWAGYVDTQQLELSRADAMPMPNETAAQIAARYEIEQIEAPPEPPKID